MHRRLLVAATAALAVAPLRAKTARPLRIVGPFAPGGSADILARVIAPHLTVGLGRNVLVENRPGAGGSIAAADVKYVGERYKPDLALVPIGGHFTLGIAIPTLVRPRLYPPHVWIRNC